jgi:hypothetical protein
MRHRGQSPSATLSQGTMVPPLASLHNVNAGSRAEQWAPNSFLGRPWGFEGAHGARGHPWREIISCRTVKQIALGRGNSSWTELIKRPAKARCHISARMRLGSSSGASLHLKRRCFLGLRASALFFSTRPLSAWLPSSQPALSEPDRA